MIILFICLKIGCISAAAATCARKKLPQQQKKNCKEKLLNFAISSTRVKLMPFHIVIEMKIEFKSENQIRTKAY